MNGKIKKIPTSSLEEFEKKFCTPVSIEVLEEEREPEGKETINEAEVTAQDNQVLLIEKDTSTINKSIIEKLCSCFVKPKN